MVYLLTKLEKFKRRIYEVRRNWLVLFLVCLAVVMMAVLPGCRSKTPKDNGDDDDNGTITTLINKDGTYNFKVADLTWEKVKEPVNASLSEMAQYDADNPNENEIETDPAENEPDFTKVSGGGVYIVDGNSKGNMCIGSIEWSGDGDSVKDGFEGFGEDDAYEMIQNGQINRVFSPHSGYAWTAYCPDWDDAGATLAQIDKYYDGRIKLYGSEDEYKGGSADPESTFVEKGAYVYTMFAKEPEEGQSLTIEKELDMTEGSVTIEFDKDGILAYPVIIKLLIRDGNGDWYLGGAPDGEELPPEEDKELEDNPAPENSNLVSAFVAEDSGSFEVAFADLSWEQVDSEVADLLDTMEGYRDYHNSPFAMVINPESTSVDLSAVTGGGLFVNSSSDPAGQLVIKGFKWEGAEKTIDETFEGAGWRALVGYNQNAKIGRSAATGYGWGAYVPVEVEANPVVLNNQINIGDGGNAPGAYAYTIFANCNLIEDDEYKVELIEEPTSVDMSAGTLTVDLTVLSPQGFKVLVRDGEGDWYLGGLPQE
jgi:hypothetical protein